MLLFRISKCNRILDLTGTGSYLFDGRWHTAGHHMLYTSSSVSMALLETLAHIPKHDMPNNFCLLQLELPQSIKIFEPAALPKNWRHYPSPPALAEIGNAFLREKKYLVMRVPSAILPMEYNYIFNPFHKDFHLLEVIGQQKLDIDTRLV